MFRWFNNARTRFAPAALARTRLSQELPAQEEPQFGYRTRVLSSRLRPPFFPGHSWDWVPPSSSTSLGHPATMHSNDVAHPLKSCLKASGSNVILKEVRFGPVGQVFEIPDGLSHYPTPDPSVVKKRAEKRAERRARKLEMRKAKKAISKRPVQQHRSSLAPSMRGQELAHSFHTGMIRCYPPTSSASTEPKPVDHEFEELLSLITNGMEQLSLSDPLPPLPTLPSRSEVIRQTVATGLTVGLSVGALILGFSRPVMWDALLLGMVGYMTYRN